MGYEMKKVLLVSGVLLSFIIGISVDNSFSYETANNFIYPVGNPLNLSYTETQAFNTSYCEGFCSYDTSKPCGDCPGGIWEYGHTGVDLANGTSGGLVRATAAGKIVASGLSGNWGNRVRIEHRLPSGKIIYSQYGHMRDTPLVKVDEEIPMGKPIGYVGSTGFSTNPHLHFEIKVVNTDGPGYSLGNADVIANYYNPLLFVNNNISDLPPCKSLARTENRPEVYWLQNAKAYHVLSDQIIQNMYNLPGWDKVYVYPAGVLEIRPPGGSPTEGTFQNGPDFITTGRESNGLLVRVQGDPKVYLIENGEKRHITSVDVFTQRGYDWNDVIDINVAVLSPPIVSSTFKEGVPISPNISQAGVINFEEFRARSLGGLGGHQEIGNFYSGVGVFFGGATSLSKADGSLNLPYYPPHSGDALIYDTLGGTGQISISLTVPATTVAGYYTYNRQLTLEALDVNGLVVQTKKSSFPYNFVGTGNPPNEYIELNYPGGIKSLRIHDSGNTYTIDDLTIKNVLTNAVSSFPQGFIQNYQDLDTINSGQPKWKQFFNNVIQNIKIILGWAGSELAITVYKPDGSIYGEYQTNTPPLEVDIPNADLGEWQFQINPVDIPYDNYPYALVIGVPQVVNVSGGAYFYPENPTYQASFSMNVMDPSSPSGWFKYYYARTRMNFVSTGIISLSGSRSMATVSGTGKVNNATGYTFTATVSNGSPDSFSIVIHKSDGSVYYSAGPMSISGGSLRIQ